MNTYTTNAYNVPGLIIAEHALTKEQQEFALASVDAGTWSGALARRTQHYGYTYDYKLRVVREESYLGQLPSWLHRLGIFAAKSCGLDIAFDQAIINEYQPRTGIGEHTDIHAFGPAVATVSLGSATQMLFRPKFGSQEVSTVPANPGDVIMMTGAARTRWTHEIRSKDINTRRVSITFRTVPK